jgi:hypothetical protein
MKGKACPDRKHIKEQQQQLKVFIERLERLKFALKEAASGRRSSALDTCFTAWSLERSLLCHYLGA